VPTGALGFLTLGMVLGLRHALDVDHLAAVATIVSRRRGVWSSALVGAAWGLGHTFALMAVAMVVIATRAQVPPPVARVLELAVAVMLVGLGLNVLRTLWRADAVHVHRHSHGAR